MHGERKPPRRGEGFGALVDQAFRNELVGDHAAQVFGRFRLHARGDFFGKQFKQKIGH